jgi:oligopeptide transport system permease protein
MSVNSKDFNGGAVATEKPESLLRDAFFRLLKNRAAVIGAIIIFLLIFIALFADQIAPTHFSVGNLAKENSVPQWLVNIFSSMKGYANISTEFVFGSDAIGRDLLSRIIYGTRVSLAVAFIGPILALLIGVTYGSISGYFGGKVDNIMMRFVDTMYGFPSILFIILMMAFFRTSLSDIQPGSFAYSLRQLDESMGGLFFIFVGIGMTSWETMARLTRGQILSIKEKEFVEAARSIGASDMRIIFKHILPNILGPLIVAETLAIPGYISTEAFLSYIGLGVNPPTPSWGAMIADGARSIRSYPYQVLLPALALAITMFAFNFLGDGLRDAFDPKLRGRE